MATNGSALYDTPAENIAPCRFVFSFSKPALPSWYASSANSI